MFLFRNHRIFFLKQKQLKVSYEIFLSSRSFGFHIPTSLEGGGRGGGGYHFCVHFIVIFTSQERQCTDFIILSHFKEEKMSQLILIFLSFI